MFTLLHISNKDSQGSYKHFHLFIQAIRLSNKKSHLFICAPAGVEDVTKDDASVRVYHAGTKLDSDALVTSGGRVLAVTVTDRSLAAAAAKATGVAGKIHFDGVFYRKDIAAKAITRSAE